ncbi:MAG TPA: hypothetical protein VLD37_02795 [Candidatus Bilamarchaeum sp.]|nr:hypothetical protein [Candidatus Bilamarchaeum sp.]
MVFLDVLDQASENKILAIWKNMSESDKAHFINQVALALSVWGSDEKGKRAVVRVLGLMTENGTHTLADFGLYVDRITGSKEASGLDEKIKRASLIIEGYRIKNSLSSEPHRELDF